MMAVKLSKWNVNTTIIIVMTYSNLCFTSKMDKLIIKIIN